MEGARELFARMKGLISAKKYRIRIHAVRHMIEEGFDERNLIEAFGGRSRILENYPSEMRCLVLGNFDAGEKARVPLHVICDYSSSNLVDIVTAYIPQKPWWVTPSKRGRLT